ncbi:MAG: GMP/IMP nucleotidase [Gammaproteobacteria bacterium]|nr:MAG: GMP/IMP nucleotidase [Gammaproteobacteria bacterium]
MIDWKAIDTVLLDMDGTLLDLHFDNHFWLEHLPRRVAQLRGQSEEDARQTLKDAYAREAGTLNWYCVDYWSRRLQLDIVALKDEVSDLIGYRDVAETFLQRLRAHGKRLVLATNAHGKVVRLKLQRTGLDQYVDRIIVSHDLGAPKEDRAFWVALHHLEPFDKARTLFVDDSLPVLKAAHDYGIAHLLQILTPDSRRPAQPPSHFNGILSYNDVMPPEVP